MYLQVKTNCIGCGLCSSICPKIFKLHAGRAQIIEEINLKSNLACIKEAIINCPVEAIKIKEYDKKITIYKLKSFTN